MIKYNSTQEAIRHSLRVSNSINTLIVLCLIAFAPQFTHFARSTMNKTKQRAQKSYNERKQEVVESLEDLKRNPFKSGKGR